MMRVTMRSILALHVAAALLGAPPAPAEPIDRVVGPHRFGGSPGVLSPFVSTHVRVSAGAAKTSNLEIGLYNFDDPPELVATRPIDLTYMVEEFEFQQRVGDAAAVRLAVAASGRLGTDTPALLTEGISAIMGWQAGVTYRFVSRPGFKLAAGLDMSRNAMTLVSPRDLVEDILENGLSDTTNSLVSDESTGTLTVGLRAAWGQSTEVGYLLHGVVGVQEPYDEADDRTVYWEMGGVVNLDMHERWTPDLGFDIGAIYRSRSPRNEDLAGGGWTSLLNVYYAGRPDFSIGVQTLFTRLSQRTTDNKFNAYGANFFLRFDFS